MVNKRLAELIAQRLSTGLVHPGNPDTQQPAVTIPLPAFRTTGMAPELARNITTTATLIAEAIVHLIETEGDTTIIDNTVLAELRGDYTKRMAATPNTVSVHCRACKSQDPLLLLTVRGEHAFIDGHQLLSGLAKRAPDCPHPIR